jgi:hypothetical protein
MHLGRRPVPAGGPCRAVASSSSRAVSSVGQSASLTPRKSQVRVLYRPPSSRAFPCSGLARLPGGTCVLLAPRPAAVSPAGAVDGVPVGRPRPLLGRQCCLLGDAEGVFLDPSGLQNLGGRGRRCSCCPRRLFRGHDGRRRCIRGSPRCFFREAGSGDGLLGRFPLGRGTDGLPLGVTPRLQRLRGGKLALGSHAAIMPQP